MKKNMFRRILLLLSMEIVGLQSCISMDMTPLANVNDANAEDVRNQRIVALQQLQQLQQLPSSEVRSIDGKIQRLRNFTIQGNLQEFCRTLRSMDDYIKRNLPPPPLGVHPLLENTGYLENVVERMKNYVESIARIGAHVALFPDDPGEDGSLNAEQRETWSRRYLTAFMRCFNELQRGPEEDRAILAGSFVQGFKAFYQEKNGCSFPEYMCILLRRYCAGYAINLEALRTILSSDHVFELFVGSNEENVCKMFKFGTLGAGASERKDAGCFTSVFDCDRNLLGICFHEPLRSALVNAIEMRNLFVKTLSDYFLSPQYQDSLMEFLKEDSKNCQLEELAQSFDMLGANTPLFFPFRKFLGDTRFFRVEHRLDRPRNKEVIFVKKELEQFVKIYHSRKDQHTVVGVNLDELLRWGNSNPLEMQLFTRNFLFTYIQYMYESFITSPRMGTNFVALRECGSRFST
jgi:hypothetical protein